MAKWPTTLRQFYDVSGGQIEVKISTENPLSSEEVEDFSRVVTACEEYAERWQPVRTERLGAGAQAQEFAA
jgi:hypothetical protein